MATVAGRVAWVTAVAVALAVLSAFPAPATAESAGTALHPVLECVQTSVDAAGEPQSYTAFFGYQNTTGKTVSLAKGAGNKLTPASLPQNQPERFLAGRQRSVFAVNFTKGTIAWTLRGNRASASAASPSCSPPTVVPELPVGILGPLAAGGVVGVFALRHRRRAPLVARS